MNTPEQVNDLVCLLSFFSLERDEQVSIFPQPYDRLAVFNFLGFALNALSNLPLTLAVFNTEESRSLSRLIYSNLEFIEQYEELRLTILLPKGADVVGYFIWDNVRYMSGRLIEVQEWVDKCSNEACVNLFEKANH
jgi:hypothetical protein